MITRNQRNRLLRAIRRQVLAEIDHSWRGGGDPDDIPELERRLKAARMNTRRMVDALTEPVPAEVVEHCTSYHCAGDCGKAGHK